MEKNVQEMYAKAKSYIHKRQNDDINSPRKTNLKYQLFYSQATGGQIYPKKEKKINVYLTSKLMQTLSSYIYPLEGQLFTF